MPNRENPRLILGVDPGSRITGYGLVENRNSEFVHHHSGCIHLEKLPTLEARLANLYVELGEVMETYHPEAMALETVFTAKNVRSAISLSHARGVIMLVAGLHKIPVYEYAPTEIKLATVGYGRATKDQVMAMVSQLLSIPIKARDRRDRFDALAAALCHFSSSSLREKIAKAELKTSTEKREDALA